MQLTPRYGDDPVLVVDVALPGPHPVMAQRRRLASTLASLAEEAWHQPSRCDGWSVQDVVTHLSSTNVFWAMSVEGALAGQPTRLLASFDPVATPALLVERSRGESVLETLDGYATSVERLGAVVDGLAGDDWSAVGEAPPGHLPLAQVADHALWDAWVHERDILLPLGQAPVVDATEVLAGLRYSAALGRALRLEQGSTEHGAVELRGHDPAVRVVVEVGGSRAVRVHDGPAPAHAARVDADAATLLDMLSRRAVGGPVPPAIEWLTEGLAEAFDQAEPPA